MNKIKILLLALAIVVVFGLVYVDFNKPKPLEITTTTTLYNKSSLMDKYISDRKFCVDDSDCHFRCGIDYPVACENRYWTVANKMDMECTPAVRACVRKLCGYMPACLCNTTIQKCYINDTSIEEQVMD